MNEQKLRELVEKIVNDSLPKASVISEKVMNIVKNYDIREKLNPYMIKIGETYWTGDLLDETRWIQRKNIGNDSDEAWNNTGLIARTKSELYDIIKSQKMKREFTMWCLEYPVDLNNPKEDAYCIRYDMKHNQIIVVKSNESIFTNYMYCGNPEHLQNFVTKVGVNDFKKYVLEIGLPKYFLEL